MGAFSINGHAPLSWTSLCERTGFFYFGFVFPSPFIGVCRCWIKRNWTQFTKMPGGRRGLVAPQNTFLENIIRRSNSQRKYNIFFHRSFNHFGQFFYSSWMYVVNLKWDGNKKIKWNSLKHWNEKKYGKNCSKLLLHWLWADTSGAEVKSYHSNALHFLYILHFSISHKKLVVERHSSHVFANNCLNAFGPAASLMKYKALHFGMCLWLCRTVLAFLWE